MEIQIEGVQVKQLTTHFDERGFFQEIIRVTDDFFKEGFGQWSMSMMYNTEVIKAWHIHQKQVDWWYCPVGVLKAVLWDRREDSETVDKIQEFVLGQQPMVLKIPPGIAHGCKVLHGPALLAYITSKTYDPADEGRIPFDDARADYDWLKGPEIK